MSKLETIKEYPFQNHNDVFIYLTCIEYGIPASRYVKLSVDDMKLIYDNDLIIKSSEGLTTVFNEEVEKDMIEKEVSERIEEYRDIFSLEKTGLSGRMGSKSDCIRKLTQFLTDNPEYSFDDVLVATQYYVENYKQISGYLQRGNYFIKKHNDSRLEELLSELQHIKETSTSNRYGQDVI